MGKRIRKAHMPKEAKKKVEAELKQVQLMSPMSAEATVVRNYIETLVNLPWKKKTKISKDIKAAQKVHDEDHYGLEKVKERLLEYLAVTSRVDRRQAPLLRPVGPPCVAQTHPGPRTAGTTAGPPRVGTRRAPGQTRAVSAPLMKPAAATSGL